jgi:hypothetical protein
VLQAIGVVYVDCFSTLLDLKEKIFQLLEHVTPELSVPPHEQSLNLVHFANNPKFYTKTPIHETQSKQVPVRQLGIIYNSHVEVIKKPIHTRLLSPPPQSHNNFKPVNFEQPENTVAEKSEANQEVPSPVSDQAVSPNKGNVSSEVNELVQQMKQQKEQYEKRLTALEEKCRAKIKAAQEQIGKQHEIAKTLRVQLQRQTGQIATQLQVPELLLLQQEIIHAHSLVQMALQQKFDDFEEELLCVICKETRRTMLFLPCKHLCVCQDCSPKVESECVICRQQITDRVRVYAFDK